jgi:hypothetical protein
METTAPDCPSVLEQLPRHRHLEIPHEGRQTFATIVHFYQKMNVILHYHIAEEPGVVAFHLVEENIPDSLHDARRLEVKL